MKTQTLKAAALAAAFLACILAANYVTTRFGMVPVGFGLAATAGTYFVGVTFILRDVLQDAAGKAWTLGAIAAGAGLSFLISDPFIALASAVAFGLSELADLAVYTPLRRRGYIRAAVTSNIVGSVIDTVAFLTLAGFPVLLALPGQMAGKLLVTAAVMFVVIMWRLRRGIIAADAALLAKVTLKAVPGPPEPVDMTVTAPLRHLCPFVNEVDDGTISIEWSTCGNTLELHELGKYLAQFAERRISHEDLTDLIRHDLEGVQGVYALKVTTHWTTAGMKVECSTSLTPAGPR